MCLRHYNIKPIVQKAARTQEVTDAHDDNEYEKKCILRVGVTCVTARAPPNYRFVTSLEGGLAGSVCDLRSQCIIVTRFQDGGLSSSL